MTMSFRVKKIISKISIDDLVGIVKFCLLLMPTVIIRLYYKASGKRVWLVCEHKTARDNGKVFYRYLKNKHPEISTYYAMNKEGVDYEGMRRFGNIVQWGSLKHYFLYMVSEWNITSHKNGNPNESLFLILQRKLGLYDNVIFLQHGVLYQNFKMFHKDNCRFRIFICGAYPEYEFVKDNFGYEGEVKYTGLARFDQLHGKNNEENIILFIPTWRRWLSNKEVFLSSQYYKNIQSVLQSEHIESVLKQANMRMYFYPHAGSWSYYYLYHSNNENVLVLNPQSTDIQRLLKKGKLMITDYSSICTDFAYMHKPIIYYQTDYTDYQQKHVGGESTYFNFQRDGFGPVVHSEEELIKKMSEMIESGFAIEDIYKQRINSFFVLRDNKNCERIYDEIMKLKK